MLVSFVIPVFNEEQSLRTLAEGILKHGAPHDLEILFVDDGTTDGSLAEMRALANEHTSVHYLSFRRNFGKSAALDAGFRAAQGEIIVTMDADLQDDPAEIPAFLARIGEGMDVVSGWKKERHDPWSKTVPSRIFNGITRRLSGLPLHDFNCGFKAYRAEVVRELPVYGELHRFMPVLAGWRGFRVDEIPVRHHARPFGRSKFGAKRFVSGFFDLMTVYFLTSYTARPMHLFGPIGLGAALLGFLTLLWLYLEKIVTGESIGARPLLFITIFLMGIGIQIMLFGLIAELIISQRKRSTQDYSVREQG